MSGKKQAHVESALEKVNANLDRFWDITEETESRLEKLQASIQLDKIREQAIDKLNSLPTLSPTVQKFASEGIGDGESEKKRIKQKIADADQITAQAKKIFDEVRQQDNDFDGIKAEFDRRIQKIINRANRKIRTTSYVSLYLDDEVDAINEINRDVRQVIASRRNLLAKMGEALDLLNQAKRSFHAAITGVDIASQNITELESLAAARETAFKIAEENKRVAHAFSAEITQRVAAIEKLNHPKFLPGEFASVKTAIDRYQTLFSAEKFAECAKIGQEISDQVKLFQEKAAELQNEFVAAEKNTQDHIKSVEDEIGSVNIPELCLWSGKRSEIQAILDKIEAVKELIKVCSDTKNRAVAFDEPNQQIDIIIQNFRNIVDLANQNKTKYEERKEICKAIVKALKSQNYDNPACSQNALDDGSPDVLSGFTIFGHNPANTGDMRLTVDLDGHIDLDVFRYDSEGNEQEVTKQDASACHKSVMSLGEKLAEFGIGFQVTDWGQAEELDFNPPPESSMLKSESTLEKTPEQERMMEKQQQLKMRERRQGK